jgi:hypothetical protein
MVSVSSPSSRLPPCPLIVRSQGSSYAMAAKCDRRTAGAVVVAKQGFTQATGQKRFQGHSVRFAGVMAKRVFLVVIAIASCSSRNADSLTCCCTRATGDCGGGENGRIPPGAIPRPHTSVQPGSPQPNCQGPTRTAIDGTVTVATVTAVVITSSL